MSAEGTGLSQAETDALIGMITNLIASASTPEMLRAQNLPRPRLALEGSVIPWRIPAPANRWRPAWGARSVSTARCRPPLNAPTLRPIEACWSGGWCAVPAYARRALIESQGRGDVPVKSEGSRVSPPLGTGPARGSAAVSFFRGPASADLTA